MEKERESGRAIEFQIGLELARKSIVSTLLSLHNCLLQINGIYSYLQKSSHLRMHCEMGQTEDTERKRTKNQRPISADFW